LAFTNGLCSLIQKELKISSVPHNGRSSAKEVQLLNKGEVDITVCQLDITTAAYKGVGLYKDKGKQPVRCLMTLNPNIIHLATWRGSGIKSITDVRGKRFNYVKPGTPCLEVFGDALLEFHGMNRNDVKVLSHTSPMDGMNTLRDRTTDLLAHFGSLGGSGLWLKLTMTADIEFLPMTEAERNYIMGKANYFRKVTMPANIYKNQNMATPGVGTQLLYIAHRDTNDDFIYKVLKVIFDDVGPDTPGRFVKFHKHTGAITLNAALLSGGLVPFHAAAVKYFKERGVWTEDFEKKQKQMLAEVGETR